MKLEIELWRLSDVELLYRVISQDEELRKRYAYETIYSEVIEGTNYILRVAGSPELRYTEMLIQGDVKENDNDFFVMKYESKKDCDNMIHFIKNAVNHINGNTEEKINFPFERIM